MPITLYSAELLQEDGVFTLVVTDRVRDTVRTTHVSRKAVEKLPTFLTMLDSKRFDGSR
jgi:hypothetical protein